MIFTVEDYMEEDWKNTQNDKRRRRRSMCESCPLRRGQVTRQKGVQPNEKTTEASRVVKTIIVEKAN